MGIAIDVTVASVYSALESTLIPSVEEVGVISEAGPVTVGKDKGLLRLHGLGANLIEITGSPVDLEEDARKTDREVGVRTFSLVRPPRSVSDV